MSEDSDRMQLPTTQYEPEQTISESDTRFLKKKCFGRNRKLLGDLCLLSGLYTEALVHYSLALRNSRNANDYLWMGSALEGLCACSVMAMLRDSIIAANSNMITIDKVNISANVPVDTIAEDEKMKIFFTVDEVITKYHECLACYKRFNTGLVQLEAHFKFIRVLLKEQKKIECAEVVQNLLITSAPLGFNETEKIDFSLMLASIHDQLSLFRKGAFYRRTAALNYIKNNNQSKPVLTQASLLLKQVCPTYKLDIKEKNESTNSEYIDGWPAVQSRVLLDMLQISQRLGNKLDCVRLLFFILVRYTSYISPSDNEHLVDMLEMFSDETEPLSNENNPDSNIKLIEPLPIIRNFQPKKLANYLQPRKSQEIPTNNPFIFSSLSTKKKEEESIVWVCDEVVEVAMVVDNPLPAEIKVNKMTLLTEGTQFEAFPATLALPAQSGSFPFMLLGTPKQPGTLVIKGYKVEVLCIVNTVLLSKPITVEVTPALPILKLSSTLPRVPNASTYDRDQIQYLFTSANLYHGHSCTGKVMLENAGNVPITKLDLKLKKPREKNVIFNNSLVQESLPLPPGETISIDVVIMPEESWLFCKNKDKLELMVTMNYTCEREEPNVYMREINWVTYVKVMPSLEFSGFKIFEIERHPTCCMICFDAVNMTSVSMNVTTELKIDNQDISNLQCCLEKNYVELMAKKKTGIEIHFPRLLLPAPKLKRNTIEDVYQQFICDSVCLNWRLADTNYSGVTFIQDMKILSDMLPLLKPRHLKINIIVNETHLDDGQCLDADECELVNISVKITNIHEENVEDVVLHINPYQECCSTQKEMKELYLPSGCLYKGIKMLNPGETFEHSCGLLFLYHGKYMVDVSCSINPKFGNPAPVRERTFNVDGNNSGLSRDRYRAPLDRRSSSNVPLSPTTFSSKLRTHEPDFWGQTISFNVQ